MHDYKSEDKNDVAAARGILDAKTFIPIYPLSVFSKRLRKSSHVFIAIFFLDLVKIVSLFVFTLFSFYNKL